MKHLYTSLFVILLTTLSLLPAQARADVPEPLTITALQASTVKFHYSTAPSTNAHTKLSYRINDGEWTTMSANIDYNLSAGSVMYIRGMCTAGINNAAETNKRYHFRISGSVDLSGDLMSLINYTQQVTEIPCTHCFFWLFYSNAGASETFNRISIHSAENLRLSATTLKQSCYEGLFRNCQNLIKGPALDAATNIPTYAFNYAFYNCYKLTEVPALPNATEVSDRGFQYAFQNCTSITSTPTLPYTTLGQYCYAQMFSGCTALETATELPATTLANFCYWEMFKGCTSLVNAPSELPATTLVDRCYKSMFEGCTNLLTAPVIKATTMPATNKSVENSGCMEWMFKGCTALKNVKVYFTAWDNGTAHSNNKNATYQWMYGTTQDQSCTFLCPCALPDENRGDNRIQTLWTRKCFYTYTFDVATNDGTWDGTDNAEITMDRVSDEASLTVLPEAEKAGGYRFTGWNTAADGTGDAITIANQKDFNSDQTFYAQFEKMPAYTFDVATTGGTWDGSDVANRVLYAELPDATPQKTGYIFLGWYTTSEGEGSTITADNKSTYTSDQTFYARFRLPDYTFNVTTNGGTWDGTDANNRVLNGALPDATPQKTGYIFLGWYTTSEGEGSTITADNKSTYTSDQTFYARFQLQPEPQSGVTELDDTQDNTTLLESLNNVTGDVLLKGRTLVGGCVNTLCLPFSLTAEQLAASPLNNCTIWEFSNFTFDGETLSVNVEPTTTLTAGVPYLVEPASNISTLLFSNVTISASTAQMRGNSSIRFIGLFSPYTLTAGSQDQLFVGAGNKLLRPSSTSALRGFRAWFRLNDGPAQAAPRAKLTFGEKPQVPTGLDNTEKDNSPRKIFINGQLYITHDGATYTPAGNVMPK